MKKPYPLIAALLFSSMLIAAPQSQHSRSGAHPVTVQEAHIHGTAQLTLALEGKNLKINFASPAVNIVGFEHKAFSEKHTKAVEKAKVHLESSALFLFSGGVCSLKQARVDMSSLSKQQHIHDQKEHDSHNEISANYNYNCSMAEKLETISVNLISLFPQIETLKVMWLTDSRQGAAELTAKSNLIRIR